MKKLNLKNKFQELLLCKMILKVIIEENLSKIWKEVKDLGIL